MGSPLLALLLGASLVLLSAGLAAVRQWLGPVLVLDSSGEDLIESWAKRNHFRVARRSFRSLRRGPFVWYPWQWPVFRLTVEDRDGLVRDAWFCCGDISGMFPHEGPEWVEADSVEDHFRFP